MEGFLLPKLSDRISHIFKEDFNKIPFIVFKLAEHGQCFVCSFLKTELIKVWLLVELTAQSPYLGSRSEQGYLMSDILHDSLNGFS